MFTHPRLVDVNGDSYTTVNKTENTLYNNNHVTEITLRRNCKIPHPAISAWTPCSAPYLLFAEPRPSLPCGALRRTQESASPSTRRDGRYPAKTI